jgi:hypothetical protein
MNILVNRNQLCLIMDKLIVDFLNLCEKILSNKTSRGVGIRWMEEAFVL